MNASVIIPAYNAAGTIAKTLEALTRQDYKGPFEVIVVDDGSTDDTPAAVKHFPNVKYVRQDNAGPAAARNHGARLAAGQHLCFTDSDCVPHADWLTLLLNGFHRLDITVVAGSYGIANPQSRLARGIHREILFRHTHLLPQFPKVFGSYNFCVKKEMFERVGGFETTYRQASGEDNDLSYKILAAGGRIYFEPKALVDHHHTTALVKYWREQFRHGFWRAKMYAEHPRMARGDDYTFWKDMIEVPWACAGLMALALSVFKISFLKAIIYFLWLPFLVFEIGFAFKIGLDFFDAIFFGFVMLVRSLVRTFGLSTGILHFGAKKSQKKVK